MATVPFRRDLPIRHQADVCVVGGGPAGLAAAVTAARQGARVVLIEGQSCLGGMGAAGLLPVFMPFGDGVHFYAGGFGREIYDRLEADGATTPERPWGVLSPPIRTEAIKRLYDRLAAEAGIETCLLTQLIAVEAADGRIGHAVCAAKSGVFAVSARVFVDASGDGDLSAWAGAPFEKGDAEGRMMPGTLCSLWSDIDWAAVRAAGQDVEALLGKALDEDPGVLPQPDPHLPGIIPVGGSAGGGNVGHAFGVDGTDERSLAAAFRLSRNLLPHYERFYRERVKGFAAAQMVATAPLFGVRETRRILGDHVLDRGDYDRRAVFPDEIGRYHYWIDTHCATADRKAFAAHLKLRAAGYRPGESYGIPYRSLTPRGIGNLLVAGRCISCDRAVQSSIRVMPGCFITGQAAGMAAAMAAAGEADVRAVAVPALQGRLAAMGAFLPNRPPA